MLAKSSARKWVCAKPAARHSTRSVKAFDPELGDRLVVGLRTLTPSTGVRIPLPQPENEKAPSRGLFIFRFGEVEMRTAVRQVRAATWTHAVRPEGVSGAAANQSLL